MFDLKDKIIALTGGGSGIGRATVLLLASLGAKVSVADQTQAALDSVAAEVKKNGHPEIMTMVVDVRERDVVDAWIKETCKWGGKEKLDCAVNLAGVVGKSIGLKGVKDQDEDEWDFIMDVNLKGLMHCLRAELNNIDDKGSIVNAASIVGIQGGLLNAAYSASKHGVIGLSRSAAKEEGGRGLRINCIAPGLIETPMSLSSMKTGGGVGVLPTPIARAGQPQECANVIAFLCSDSASFITGAVYSVDGGWNC